jgi:dihydrofolate synthase/folylpolyglutamate synthase
MSPIKQNPRAEIALTRLGQLHPKLIDLGLDRTYALLENCGQPHLNVPPVIHIAGTNGKGSTLAFIRAMLEQHGKSVHVYSSPHLVRFNERIRLAGTLIDDDALADLLEDVEARNNGAEVTFFEVTTAAAMLAFSRKYADFTLLETGLGGRMDSTNIIDHPKVTIISPIARDHEHFLGNTISAIAHEKAGIMKPGVPVISASQHPEAEAVLRDQARTLQCPFIHIGTDIQITHHEDNGFTLTWGDRVITCPAPQLQGDHQIDNAVLAAAAVMLAEPDITSAAIRSGVASANWPARIQPLTSGRLVDRCPAGQNIWLDGAHNRHGAEALVKSLTRINSGKWVMIAGALNTRPAADFLDALKPLLHHLIAITIPDQDASLTADALSQTATELGIASTPAPDLNSAIDIAMQLTNGDIPLIIGGSLYLSGHVLTENGTLPD